MFKEYGVKIIQICGVISALTVVGSSFIGNTEGKEFIDYIFVIGFALFAYVPFAILGHIAKKNITHVTFFAIFGLLMFALDMYAKYDAFFVANSSTGALVNVVMPVYFIGIVLIMWGGYAIFKKIHNKKETTETVE